MGSDQVDVEVFAPGFACDGTRVTIPDFAQALTLITWPAEARITLREDQPVGVVPQLLIRFGPTGRHNDGYEVWEEIGREVVA